MLDFYNVVKKIFIRLRMFTESAIPTASKDAATGYAHTFSDCHGIDLTALSAFPTDEEINEAAKQAYNEAENLLFILGISPDLSAKPTMDATSAVPTATPWESTDEFEDDDDDDNDSDGEEVVDEAAEIGYLYECAEMLEGSSVSRDHQRLMKDLSYASVMLHTHQDLDM